MGTGPMIRPPKQRRSQETLERVLTAAEELLVEVGYDGFTLSEIGRRAQVGMGSVYIRFNNKETLIAAVHQRMLDRQAAHGIQLPSPWDSPRPSLDEMVAASVRVIAESFASDSALLRVFMILAVSDEGVRARGEERVQAYAQLFQDILLSRRDEINHPSPELAIDTAWRLVFDVLARYIIYDGGWESPRPVQWEALVEELGVAVSAYLTFGRGVEAPDRDL
jgi:AcrR family transcriptional regulator